MPRLSHGWADCAPCRSASEATCHLHPTHYAYRSQTAVPDQSWWADPRRQRFPCDRQASERFFLRSWVREERVVLPQSSTRLWRAPRRRTDPRTAIPPNGAKAVDYGTEPWRLVSTLGAWTMVSLRGDGFG
eukprot:3530208-Rhodomonas_salina.2